MRRAVRPITRLIWGPSFGSDSADVMIFAVFGTTAAWTIRSGDVRGVLGISMWDGYPYWAANGDGDSHHHDHLGTHVDRMSANDGVDLDSWPVCLFE